MFLLVSFPQLRRRRCRLRVGYPTDGWRQTNIKKTKRTDRWERTEHNNTLHENQLVQRTRSTNQREKEEVDDVLVARILWVALYQPSCLGKSSIKHCVSRITGVGLWFQIPSDLSVSWPVPNGAGLYYILNGQISVVQEKAVRKMDKSNRIWVGPPERWKVQWECVYRTVVGALSVKI